MEDLVTLAGVLGMEIKLATTLKSLGWNTMRLATLADAESQIWDTIVDGARTAAQDSSLKRDDFSDLVKASLEWAEVAWKVEGGTNGSDLFSEGSILRAQHRMNALREERISAICALVPRKGTAVLARWPTRLDRLKSEASDNLELREKAEKSERDRWIGCLRGILMEVDVPASRSLLDVQGLTLTRRFGKGRRSSTLRKHVKTWVKFRTWLVATFGVKWPAEPFHFSTYLEARADEPCGKSIPASLLKTLIFMENAAEVPKSDQINNAPTIRNTLEEVALQLESVDMKPKKQALLIPVAVVISWERTVLDEDLPRFARAYAWFRLMKLWGCMRFDDTTGLAFDSLIMQPFGLEGELRKTKTSGPGKRVNILKLFISHDAYIREDEWLPIGWKLWKEMSVEKDMTKRDFFLPAPNRSLQGITRRFAGYAMASTMSHALSSVLKTRFEGGTVKLLAEGVSLCWTEHSERATLRSWSRVSGIPEDVCKRLGRWTPTVDQSYDRTIRATVLRAQANIAKFVRGSFGRADPFDEGLVLQKVASTMEELGYYSGEIQLQIEKLTSYVPAGHVAKKVRWTSLRDGQGSEDSEGSDGADDDQGSVGRSQTPEVESVRGEEEEDDSPELVEGEAVQQPPFGTYMVAIVGRSKKRTLHRMGECHRKPGAHFGRFEVLGSDLPSSSEYHRACKICFPLGLNQTEEVSGEESSSGDASSSDSKSEED